MGGSLEVVTTSLMELGDIKGPSEVSRGQVDFNAKFPEEGGDSGV